MKYKILGIIFCILINRSYSLTVGECEVTDNNKIALGLLEEEIDDVGKLDIKYPFAGELRVNVSTGDEQTASKYIDIDLTEDKLTIKTNKNFEDFEKDKEQVDNAATIEIKQEFTLICDSKTVPITLILTVTDTNNHAPEFDSPTYSYKLSSPLTPLVDLSSAGDQIVVTDLDFSNSNVTFTVDPPGNFVVDTIPVSGSPRKYRGVLKVTEYTTLPKTTSLTITATDKGTPQSKIGTAEITIEVDSDSSLADKPSLSQALYRFDYDADNNSLTPATGQKIKITASNTENNIDVKILDEAGDKSLYFQASYDSPTALVTIETTDTKLEPSSDSLLVLTLEVFYTGKDKDVSTSVILIQLPSELVAKAPSFSQLYYRTTYKINGETPTLDPAVTFTVSDENANVTFEEDINEVSLKKENNTWTVEIAKLDEDTVKKGEDVVLSLKATVSQNGNVLEGFATLIISLPQQEAIKVPKFTQSLYTASYKNDGNGNATIELNDVDKIEASSSEGHAVKIQIDGSEPSNGAEYFAINDDGTVNLLQDISPDDLKAGAEYTLALKATVSDTENVEPGYSTLRITIPTPTAIPSPKFKKYLYKATYSKSAEEENGVVDLADTISATSEGQTVDITAYEFQRE